MNSTPAMPSLLFVPIRAVVISPTRHGFINTPTAQRSLIKPRGAYWLVPGAGSACLPIAFAVRIYFIFRKKSYKGGGRGGCTEEGTTRSRRNVKQVSTQMNQITLESNHSFALSSLSHGCDICSIVTA